MTLRALAVPLGLILLIAGGVTLRVMRSAEPKSIEIEQAERRLLAPTIFASGVLAYSQEVRLVPEVLARVTGIRVREGQAVRKGELLLTLDAAAAQGAVRQLDAARAQALITIEHERVDLAAREKKLQRYARLREEGMVDASTYDDLVSQRDLGQLELRESLSSLQQTEAQLAQARVQLDKTQVRAPIAGVVTSVLIKQGETAVPSAMSIAGGDLMVVAQTDQQYAEINVDETDVAEVAPGQSARVVPAALPDASWAGQVTSVSVTPKEVSGQSKSFTVRIRLDSTAVGQFHSGMSCRAEILTRRADAHRTLAVPVEAVHYEEPVNRGDVTRASVFVIQNGVAHGRAVETGAADDAYIEVLRGLAIGERVAAGPARALRFLREGDHVRQGTLAATEAR
jgi:HlyD family secretion protein